MRCYRCGAQMDAHSDVCPACGFDLHSPVEVRMYKGMTNIRIYDDDGSLLWEGDETGTAYISAPERKNILICWGTNLDVTISVKNGEAFRFEHSHSRMAKRLGDASIVKTRTISKR